MFEICGKLRLLSGKTAGIIYVYAYTKKFIRVGAGCTDSVCCAGKNFAAATPGASPEKSAAPGFYGAFREIHCRRTGALPVPPADSAERLPRKRTDRFRTFLQLLSRAAGTIQNGTDHPFPEGFVRVSALPGRPDGKRAFPEVPARISSAPGAALSVRNGGGVFGTLSKNSVLFLLF